MDIDRSQDNVIDTLLDEAFAKLEQGLIGPAQSGFQAVLKLDPQQFDALHMLGVIAMQARDFTKSIELIGQAIAVDASVEMAHANLGIAWMESQQPDKALPCFDQAIALLPTYAEAHFGRGVALLALKQWDKAIASFDQVLARQPDNAEAHFNRGNALLELKRAEEAVASYNQTLALQSRHVSALINRAHAYLALKRPADAIADCDQAIALQADRLAAFSGKGDACMALQRYDEAIACYQRSLQIQPDQVAVLVNLGGALRETERWQEALEPCRRAIALAPDTAAAHMNLGNALLDLGRLSEAGESFAKACALQPDHADAQWGRGWADLLAGNWERGLPQLEWRWKKSTFTSSPRAFTQPLWLGDADVRGRTILLHAEQGLGDTIQFCRYAPLLIEQGAKVLLEVQAPLKSLLQSLHPEAQVVARDVDTLPAFDLHCPLMSLPLAFKSTPSSAPAPASYLKANPHLVEALNERLGTKRPRVGMVWSGNAAHRNDHNRSMALPTLLSAMPEGVQLHVLQKDIRDADAATIKAHPQVLHWPEALQSFDHTAALISQMDVVISVDTSVAHLAAALGKSTWILLSKMPDWRWLMNRPDSPWYPSARLFRQQVWGQWTEPLNEVAQALAQLTKA